MPIQDASTLKSGERASLHAARDEFSIGISRAAPASSARAFNAQKLVLYGVIFLTAFVIFAALRLAGDYYRAPLVERPKYSLHETFKPSGLVGQGFGVIGGLFCLLTLLYPLRKRWRLLENLGAPRVWFQFHVYFGIAGPLLATLHTTFKFGGLASICYWSMMLVMASGFVGRFLFAQLPRNQRGIMLSLKEIEAEIKVVQRHLETMGWRSAGAEAISASVPGQNFSADWRSLLHLWLARRREIRVWRRHLRRQGLSSAATHRLLSILSRKLFLESSRVTLDLTTRAFSHWHTLHLPFTYLMFITLLIHAGLAIFLGYTWIF
ncbi:MAG: hypothetical protein ONB46_01420 [candidate division KSB1 bacterium]|nr:hypothetical protein [candidate division KSB1 bacterium]MDZ7364325.1 hypothetical protein [candidate division KSB1 bacterium]MDZ7402697.1 hypothetical protein [candidate division KSB1 bacterium]